MRFRVTCTIKLETNEYIAHLGCNANNAYVLLTEVEVITRIESHSDTFYVERPAGRTVEVVIAKREGRKYLKTESDGEKPDNLLSLPDCPPKKNGSGVVRTVVAAASHGDECLPYWGA
jgi:hypothetical protein